ncbi:hypothetical protein MuYL_4142 [Mucilaginibacter xinganensis]|uniref:Uncharacterized protein n=1 Tax=Mucilaginibacter xinganensis TaxID=1234841 RepID=A0A223P1Q7_9SPHI|nr:hypothetical protein MuYL_4142 [Mucilaginibacter xinganensis]
MLANPAGDAQSYNYNLQRLVNDFPQSGILQALLAHSSDEKNLKKAAAYFNPKALYKLINAPASLMGVSDENIIFPNGKRYASISHTEPSDVNPAENYFSDHTATVTETETAAPATDVQFGIAHEFAQPEPEAHLETTGHEILSNGQIDYLDQTKVAEQDLTASTENGALNESLLKEPFPANAVETIYEDVNGIAGENTAAIPGGHSDVVSEHQQPDETPAEVSLADTAVPETVIPEMEVPHMEDSLAAHTTETKESAANEVKDDVENAAAYTEPIINYAFGMGYRMPPDGEAIAGVAGEGAPENVTAEPAATDEIPEVSYDSNTENQVESNVIETLSPESPSQQQRVFADPVTAEYIGFTAAAAEARRAEQEAPVSKPDGAEHSPEVAQVSADEPNDHSDKIDTVDRKHELTAEAVDEVNGNLSIEPDIISNIAATDYFRFDQAFGGHEEQAAVNETEPVVQQIQEAVNSEADDADQQDVTKYNDEKLPYSFLWWLDKTRKEHAGVYQPYVPAVDEKKRKAKVKPGTDELQQQYYENIFHITSVEELDKITPPPPHETSGFTPKLKEQVIIERFIQEEPQIRPQSSDKLDNENKAKKSSEDRDELVSETLAAIYSDQMLYHKAIASYKKLMLRFPEKSRYFAEKIEQLEKKTN